MTTIDLYPPAAVHLIGICGTGMGNLAGLLAARGFQVTGSDLKTYPPMSDELRRLGISVEEGYRPENIAHRPNLVVVGNVCKKDHVEVLAAIELGLPIVSMPAVLRDLLLVGKHPMVIAGTHGKTTTTALTAYLLHACGTDPSFLAGGVLANFGSGHRLGAGPWFVVEGDEYDSAYFEKFAKFLSYQPRSAVLTSVEHDHIDIYPTPESYRAAFESFVQLLPRDGLLAVYGADAAAVAIAAQAQSEVVLYAVAGEPTAAAAAWLGIPQGKDSFDLSVDGAVVGRFRTPLPGRHNLRNTLAALILCHRVAEIPLKDLAQALPSFCGVRRRQEVIVAGQITIYDDFAHHPTAVRETLLAIAPSDNRGHPRLLAVFEPRSATACRKLHQEAYVSAFDSADRVILAPPGRHLSPTERLDTKALAQRISARGIPASAAATIDDVFCEIRDWARPGDRIALMSNGDFGGLAARLMEAFK